MSLTPGRRLSRRRRLEGEIPLSVAFGSGLGLHVDAHVLVMIVGAVCRPVRQTRAVRVERLDEIHEVGLHGFGYFVVGGLPMGFGTRYQLDGFLKAHDVWTSR